MNNLSVTEDLADVSLSVFDGIVAKIKQSKAQRLIPLHQGKTHFTTPVELREWSRDEFPYPHYHDGPSKGVDIFIDEVSNSIQSNIGRRIDSSRIQITNGITHALASTFGTLLAQGGEVVVLSPHWLFSIGLIRAAGGQAVELPCFDQVSDVARLDIESMVEEHIGPETKAIYFNHPNNPTGRSLNAEQVSGLLNLCRRKGLYLISDNAYENYGFEPHGFVDPLSFDGADDFVFGCYSFSKSHGLTGYRVGYLVSPPASSIAAQKRALYSIYSVPTVSQFVAMSALRQSVDIVRSHRRFVEHAMAVTNDSLDVPHSNPIGGFYSFLDLSQWRGGNASDQFIGECISQGVSLAPGHAFGSHCVDKARICYSVVDHDSLRDGINIINEVYRRGA